MQDKIKRHFWLVPVIAVMLCAFYAAKAAAHIAEAKLLGDAKTAPPARQSAQVLPEPRAVRHSKDGTQLGQRNMFCSDCTPSIAESSDPSSVPLTSLALQLVATNVSGDDSLSFASVVNSETQFQGGYRIGDKIPGAGAVKSIHYKYIDFENSGRLERLVLVGVTGPVIPPPVETVAVAPPPAEGVPSKDELQAALDSGIKKIDENNYEIDRSLVDKALANPMAIAKGARIVPSVKDGKADGFKLYAIRQSSVYAKLGLTNGDTLQAINGFELTSAEKALEVYTKLREASSLEVSLTRRGKPVNIKYAIR
jgi:general secretion pathway protein C